MLMFAEPHLPPCKQRIKQEMKKRRVVSKQMCEKAWYNKSIPYIELESM